MNTAWSQGHDERPNTTPFPGRAAQSTLKIIPMNLASYWQCKKIYEFFNCATIRNCKNLLRQIEALRLTIHYYEYLSQANSYADDSESDESFEGFEDLVDREQDGAFWHFLSSDSSDARIFNLPNMQGFYPIHQVVLERQEDLINPVLDATYDIYVKSYQGLTAFHYAARDGFLAFFQGWQVGSVNFEIKDEFGRTPMWYALARGQQEIVDFLRANRRYK